MSLLTPDLGLLFWMLLSFLLVFGALVKFGFPIITGMVDKRREHISSALAEADKARERIENVEQEARKMMDEATRRSSEILSAAVAESQQIVDSARERADADAAARIEAAKSRIAIEKEKALGEMRATVATLSVDVAEKILRSKLSTEEGDKALIDRFVEEAEKRAER